jgi:beta-lactamase class A
MMTKKAIVLLGIILCALGAAVYLSSRRVTPQPERVSERLRERRAAWAELAKKVKDQARAFGQETGIVIEDLSTEWRIVLNQDAPFPAASMVKVPIMASCFYASANGELDLKKFLELKGRCKVSGSGILKTMPERAEFTIEDLIELMIAESDNTATNMLIDYLGYEYLNRTFKKLGLKNTTLVRKMMDFRFRSQGKENFTSARDLALLFKKIYKGRLIDDSHSQKCLSFLKEQKMRDRIPRRLPPGTIVAHKTGLENLVCHDAGIVFTPKGDFLICVLTRHRYKTAKLAKKFIAQIARDTYDYYQQF